MLLRPNYMLSGHALPVFFARELGEDFSYCAAHGMIATTFDSLIGQYAAQGPNHYMLARLHDDPTVPVPQVLDEYYTGFGAAEDAVRRYFELWERVAGRYTEELCAPINTHWVNLYVDADAVFTAEVMAEGRALLDEARQAAGSNPVLRQRVALLETGLRHAELTMGTQQAHRIFLENRDFAAYHAALQRLDDYRLTLEGSMASNLAFLRWNEDYTWSRQAAALMAGPHEQLADGWRFAWDPDRQGEVQGWSAVTLDASGWLQATSRATWDRQPVGEAWKAAHGADYTGVAWYRQEFAAREGATEAWLVFGAAASACQVWLNGELVHTRPWPIWGSPDSWKQPFAVDISKAVRPGQPNVLTVRVECSSGSGGLWQPVWVAYPEPR
jgi:hypothetical protein